MFENLLGQDEIAWTLRADIEGGALAPALLFSGPPGSGKLTAALEVARALSCGGSDTAKAVWNCLCPACVRHRLLAHPDLLLLGPRTFPEEIAVGIELLKRSPGPASAYFFVRAVRKLVKRFDAVLYEGEQTRLAKAAPLLRELDELLDAVAPERAVPGSLLPGAVSAAEKAAANASKLEALVPDSPPVFMVRNVEAWARLTPLGSRKVAIIENAESMQEAGRNAMLKVLEEPPESCRFILLTSRRSSIIGTILSRTRNYAFKRRTPSDTALVIERIFKSSEDADSIETYFAARRAFPPRTARGYARSFLAAALASRPDAERLCGPLAALASEADSRGGSDARLVEDTLSSLCEATKDFGQKDEGFSGSFTEFLTALCWILTELLHTGRSECADEDASGLRPGSGLDAEGAALVNRIAALVRTARSERESLNRNAAGLVEWLFYAIAREDRFEGASFRDGAL